MREKLSRRVIITHEEADAFTALPDKLYVDPEIARNRIGATD